MARFLYFFFFLFSLQAARFDSASQASLTATLSNDPSSLIDGKISVVTGSPSFASVDLVIQGKEPIYLTRYYLGNDSCQWSIAWDFAKAYEMKEAPYRWILQERGEAPFIYKKEGKIESEGKIWQRFRPSKLNKGVSNTTKGKISARTNPFNHELWIDEKTKFLIVHRADGTIRRYKKVKDSEDEYQLLSEKLPNGNWILYEYLEIEVEKNQKKRLLEKIYTTNPSQTKTYAFAKFHYHDPKRCDHFYIEGSDGQTLSYSFDLKSPLCQKLTHHVSSQDPLTQYQYQNDQIEKISFPLERSFRLNYYKTKAHEKKVESLSQSGQISHRLRYDFEKPYDNKTIVTDAEGNDTIYHFGQDLRIRKIEHFSKSGKLCKKEEWCWGDEKLQWQITQNEQGETLFARRYLYDAIGNILEEHSYGNLSGNSCYPELNHLGELTNSSECYKKFYRYSDGPFHLLLEEWDDFGKKIVYDYLEGTDLIQSKLFFDHEKIEFRKFYRYNDDLILIEEIEDDGNSNDLQDLSRVEVRRICRYFPILSGPYTGLNERIDHLYLEKGEEKLLTRHLFSYTKGAKISEEKLFGRDGKFYYSRQFFYDNKGRLTLMIDPMGYHHRKEYDLCLNLIKESCDEKGISTSFLYNSLNQKTEEIIEGKDGLLFKNRYQYNLRGEKIQTIDPRGWSYSSQYDALGHEIKTTLPPVFNEQGTSLYPQIQYEKDLFGNCLKIVDPIGYITKTEFTSWNKPKLILYPDGAKEEFFYNLDGTLSDQIDPSGILTHFEYNAFGDLLSKESFFHHKKISSHQLIYKGRRLVKEIDAEGNITTYGYDGAGRKIEESCNGETLFYSYDNLGRQAITSQGDLVVEKEYDLLSRVTEERKKSSSGTVLEEVFYTYDPSGNLIEEKRGIQNGFSIQSYRYDSLGRLIEKKDPLQFSHKISYDDFYQDAFGHTLLRKKEIDPLGMETIEIYDPQKNLIKREKWKEELLSFQERIYSMRSELIHQIDLLQTKEEKPRLVHTKWKHDSRKRVLRKIEAADSSEERSTFYQYNPKGEICQITKPNKVSLFYEYDERGYIAKIYSSDYSVCHRYEHDKLGRAIRLDGIQRQFDGKNRLTSEIFPKAKTVITKFDSSGRKSSLHVEALDLAIEYDYEGFHLQKIQIEDLLKKRSYSHRYLKYDRSGHSLKEELIGAKGFIEKQFDAAGRAISVKAPEFEQTIERLDPLGHIYEMTLQGKSFLFGYDDLYQLTKEAKSHYRYDSLQNRIEKNDHSYETNLLCQLPKEFIYDENGNPIQYKDFSFQYDALDRLIQIKTNEWVLNYCYDPLHRRLSSTLHSPEGKKELYFLYDGQNEIGSLDENLKRKEFRVLNDRFLSETGAAIFLELQGKSYVPIHDLQGNLASLLSLDKEESTFFSFNAFGEKEKGPSFCPWGFASKREEEKIPLIYFGRRFYLPELGRWLTPDPIGFTDGMNLYAFVQNNPLSYIDLYGLTTYDWQKGWINSPGASPYSYTSSSFAPEFLQNAAPSEWKGNYQFDLPFLPSIDPRPSYTPHFYINGIDNTYLDHMEGAQSLQRQLGQDSHVVPFYSKTEGFFLDVISVFDAKREGYQNQTIENLRRRLKLEISCLEITKDPRKIFATCFSRGASDLYHAVKDFSSEEKERLVIHAYGPTKILPRDLGFSVTNYISEADWCSMVSSGAFLQSQQDISSYADLIMLSPERTSFLELEHKFLGDTYQKGIEQYTKPVYEQLGGPIQK